MSAEACTDRLREQLSEAALGVLDEPERGEVLAHASSCPACGRLLDELVQVSDRLVALAPEAEPPPGFEHRVVASVGTSGEVARRRRSVAWLPAAAAVLVLVAGFVVGLWLAPDDEGLVGFDRAPLRTADGEVVGDVLLAGDEERAVVVRLDRYRASASYTCRLVLSDGSLVDVGRWQPDEDDDGEAGWWAATTEITGTVVAAHILGADGTVWAEGRLS